MYVCMHLDCSCVQRCLQQPPFHLHPSCLADFSPLASVRLCSVSLSPSRCPVRIVSFLSFLVPRPFRSCTAFNPSIRSPSLSLSHTHSVLVHATSVLRLVSIDARPREGSSRMHAITGSSSAKRRDCAFPERPGIAAERNNVSRIDHLERAVPFFSAFASFYFCVCMVFSFLSLGPVVGQCCSCSRSCNYLQLFWCFIKYRLTSKC